VDVTLREMRWAIVVAQHRSLRQAAEALSIRQSTLSRRLRDLEHQLGAVMFERTDGGTRPTIEDRSFSTSRGVSLRRLKKLATRLRTRSRGESGGLAIGVHASLSVGNLPCCLSTFAASRRSVLASSMDQAGCLKPSAPPLSEPKSLRADTGSGEVAIG
jgi:DNA-binding transcriptional LysR family regulator